MEFCTKCTFEWIAAILAVSIGIYLYGTWNYDAFKKRKLPFSKPTVFVGNMGSFLFGRKSLANQSQDLYNKFKGHRAYGFFNLRECGIYVTDPEALKMITVKDFDHFTDHFQFIEPQDDLLFGKFLFSLKGSQWKHMRNLLSPAFTSSKMKTMFLLVAKCGEQLGDYLQEKCKESEDGVYSVEMRDLFSRYTNDVIATSAYGIQCDSLRQPSNEFYEMGKQATDFGGWRALVFILFGSVPRLMRMLGLKVTPTKVTNFFVSIVTDTMAVREKEHIVRPDMIQLLMEARKGTLKADDEEESLKQDKKSGPVVELADEDIAAQAFLFFIAGFDTSSTLLSFLAYELALHPDIQERVRQEIDEVLQEDGGRLTYDGIQKMKYLDAVISETLRLWPPVTDNDRVCVKDYTLPATDTQPRVVFKKGETVMLPIYAIHRDPDNYPEPERFDPERFSEENKHNIKPFTYLPFGYGPRICIGFRFAQMETKIAMACVLSRFLLEVTSRTPIPVHLEKGTFNTSAEGGCWLGIKPRPN